jgi:hypothetical protein
MALTPIVELGVSEAYAILTEQFGITDLPPLDSIENEDWGRDYLLSRFLEIPHSALAKIGLSLEQRGREVDEIAVLTSDSGQALGLAGARAELGDAGTDQGRVGEAGQVLGSHINRRVDPPHTHEQIDERLGGQ